MADQVSEAVAKPAHADPPGGREVVVDEAPAAAVIGNAALGAVLAPPPPASPGSGADDPGGRVGPALLRMLQRKAGNGAVQAFMGPLHAGRPPTVQRSPDVAVTGVRLSASKVSVPPSSAPKATAAPANATGVTFTVEKDTVDPTNVTVDASGAVTVGSGQQGGRINVKATSSDGSWATAPLQMVEKPTGVASTSASGADNYGGQFVHTFSAPSGKPSGLEGENINEKFASLSAPTPWGGTFTLSANVSGSHGWDLDSGGAMAGPDNVSIGAAGVDVGPFVKSASNPSPKGSLPQGFTMTQNLHAKSFPAGTLDGTAFTTVPHKRTLVPGPKFEVEAGAGKVTEEYSGPAAVTNAKATPAGVMASPPKPKSGTWAQTKVQVSADMIPSSRTATYSIRGNALGCSVDASGVVSIGALAGSIVVRVTASPKNFDEVTITITEYKAPTPTPATPKPTSTGDESSDAADVLQGVETGVGGVGRPAATPVQRQGPPPSGGATAVPYRGQMFGTDPAQIRTMLETLIGERGMDDAETVVYAFLRMGPEEKIPLQLSGVDPDLLERAQHATEPVLKAMQEERKTFVDGFRDEAAAGARKVLDVSRQQLQSEMDKYSEDGTPPDLDGMRAAAKALAAKRRAADAAGEEAKTAFEKMRTQLQAPAGPTTVAPAPIMPVFPNPELRETARTKSEAWWALEKEYGQLRTTHEAKYPALALYSDNDDGKAAGRLEDLPTWGPWADARMKKKVYDELESRFKNNKKAASDLDDPEKVWVLPKMVQLGLQAKAAKPFQEQWVKAKVAEEQKRAADEALLIAEITIAVTIAAALVTAGGSLLVEAGVAGAGVVAAINTGAAVASAGVTIYSGYRELEDYESKSAASGTALDRANAIGSDDPSLFWLAVTLAGVILEIGALKAAFTTLRTTIQTAKASRSVVTLAEDVAKVPGLKPATAETIIGRVTAEIEALPPPPPQEAAAAALNRLSNWDAIPAAERPQVVIDALRGGGDPTVVLTRSGKNARELLALLGKESEAGRTLQGMLNVKAFREVGPALKTLAPDAALDDAAVARIVSRNDVGQIKGQILEEAMGAQINKTLAAGADDAGRQALLRGVQDEGQAQFIAGSRITDSEGRQLTDGMVARLKGDNEIEVIRALESKAGRTAKGELSREAARKFADLPKSEQEELLEDAAKILRRRRPDLRALSPETIIESHRQAVMDVIAKEFPQTSEWGQAVRTSERLGMDVDDAGHDIPAEILVDGVRRKVVFPKGEGRPQITGVLPSDIKPGRMPAKVAKEQGVNLDIMNVKGVDQAKLKALSEQVATAKGLPVK